MTRPSGFATSSRARTNSRATAGGAAMQPAAFIHGKRDVRLGELAAPVAGAGTVLLDVTSVGICGSDLHYYKDGGIGSDAIAGRGQLPGRPYV